MTATDDSEFDPRTQLIPHVVDHYAQVKPNAIYAEYPVSPTSYADGYRPVTFRAFANAINGISWWLTETLGPGSGEILAYVGPNDLRYPALVLGAIKAGYCMFLTSPRNSVEAHGSLFQRLNCIKLVAPVPRPPPVTAIQEAVALDILDAPSVDELLQTEYSHFPFEKSYPAAAGETLAVIHTSGSTGIPKPIFWTHDTACKSMHMGTLDPPEGFDSQDRWCFGKRMFLVPPPFHAAGIANLIFIGLSVGMTMICPTSGGLPTATALVEAMKQTPIDVALTVPSIIQELAQNPDLLDFCSEHLGHLVYCGGDLPQAIGDRVAAKIKLLNQYGASEVGMISSIQSRTNRDPLTDWGYININPQMGAEFQPVADDAFELVLVRSPEHEPQQWPFTIFPDRQEYRTRDLFVRHPDPNKPDLWRWSARADDVIVFLNGEKTNPVSMEQHILASNPAVTAALVAGAQRFQASLLVELAQPNLSVSERATMIEQLWPSIEQANAVCPAHARIAKTHILFTHSDKPMLRAGKGTVQRAGTLALYASELDDLYADADALHQTVDGLAGPGRVDDAGVIADYIRHSLLSITGWNLTDTENFFHRGLDSLQAITAARTLKTGLCFPAFTANLIYLHPSVAELTQAVMHLQHHQDASAEAKRQAQLHERDTLLQELIGEIDIYQPPQSPASSTTKHTVILTGSTGNLGTYILATLLRSPSIAHVHCLNRSPCAQTIQEDRFLANSLPPLDPTRTTFYTVPDLSQPSLGLPPATLTHLQTTTTLIIHNAWPVNFNLSLSSFRPHLSGVTNLLNFTARASLAPHFFLISSISAVMGHRSPDGLTPEINMDSTTTPGPNGYANSKYIAEGLVAHAARQNDVRASVARVGQIAGAVRAPGLWNRAEWFPSLVLSALHLGCVPETLGVALDRINWVPVDLLAEVLVELALEEKEGEEDKGRGSRGEAQVFHPVNLRPLRWEEVRPVVVAALAGVKGEEVQVVEWRAWVRRVRRDVEGGGEEEELQEVLRRNPAAKLLDFFEGVMAQESGDNVLDTQRTGQRSEKLREVDAVKEEWMRKWVGEWVIS
ncbi:hypothetical protein FE257_002554 [Aspergillus nanangensis]|uniref:NRPS-like enzyme n=1 Tax=Aspergillus nanangensis TaxID=2582783 RepID=A0AAD4CTG9_ASPNN|nr:hypothetical protein FE257_002554 [Aspergillus nanangensis]